MNNYYLDSTIMGDEVKIWSQMFFDDGSVTPGKYIPVSTYADDDSIKSICRGFLSDSNRVEGVIFLWGAGQVYARKARIIKNMSMRLTKI